MTLQIHTPTGPASQYIAQMVYHRGFSSPHDQERFLPDGGVELVIDLTSEPKYIFDSLSLKPLQKCRGAWVSGMRTAPITISAAKASDMLVICFQPFGAHPVWGVPLHELRDVVADADAVLGLGVWELRDRLLETPDISDRFGLVEDWVVGLSTPRPSPPASWGLAQFAVEWIRRKPTMTSIDDLARNAGASNRHLIQTFKQFVGPTPKQFQRVHRFQRVIGMVETRTAVDWAGLAVDCGYYDQAHLIRDFRHFSGFTPSEYLAAKGTELNYVPVGPPSEG